MASKATVPTEHMEQTALFSWARLQERAMPALRLLFAIPNGAALVGKTARRPDGKTARFSLEAIKLKAEGLKPGVPDVCLPVARGGHHGLYIEMKRRKGGVMSDEQNQWRDDLTSEGYLVARCNGWDEARDLLTSYLKDDSPA